jgi:Holliday junction resolvase RusA-like endonuclease
VTGDIIRFEVRGFPAPQGDLKVGFKSNGRANLYHRASPALNAWRNAVASAAQSRAPAALWSGPVGIRLAFGMLKPVSAKEWVGRGKARHRVRLWAAKRPDVDKLIRAVLDALTGVIFEDDKQIVRLTASKDYGVPGVRVVLTLLESEGENGGSTRET